MKKLDFKKQLKQLYQPSTKKVKIEKVHRFIEETGRRMAGKHHEIYLSDIRRAAPEKWKTIIRQPMN